MLPYLNEDSEDLGFQNPQVFGDQIPSTVTLEYSGLEQNLLKADIIFNVIFFSVGLIVASVLRWVFEIEFMVENLIYIVPAILAVMLLVLAYTYYEFQNRSYAIRQKDIVYNKGLFWKSTTAIPFNRVQHCEVSQGPIDRYFDLSELKIFTAGGASSDLSISGLSPDNARRIKDFIVNKASIDEEE